jgi:hypothetical protein
MNNFTPYWIGTYLGRYLVTVPYLEGARAARKITAANPAKLYGPGPQLAQYTYGYCNERAGCHDHIDLPPIPTK